MNNTADDLVGTSAKDLGGKLVSVIMPAYNAEKFLEAAIESVIRQSYSPWELIIVDDGSTDTTADIAKKMMTRDQRIRYFYQTNGKQAKARNRAIRESKGSYLAFLDADDLWVPERLEKQMACISQNSVDLVFSDSYVVSDAGVDERKRMNTIAGYLQGRDALALFFRTNQIPILTVLVKREAVNSVDNFSEDPDIQHAEDYHLWMKLLVNGSTFFGLEEPLAYYRLHDGQSTGKDWRATFQAINALLSLDIQDKKTRKIRNDNLIHWYRHANRLVYFKNDTKQAINLSYLSHKIKQYCNDVKIVLYFKMYALFHSSNPPKPTR